VVSAVIVNGTDPVWVHPHFDEELHFAHPPEPEEVRRALEVNAEHKMGGAIEQSSCVHLQGDLVDPTVLKQRLDLLGTTSASTLVYAALDGWRRQMVEQGHDLLDAAIRRARRVREAIEQIDGLHVIGEEVLGRGGAFELDPLSMSISVRDLGVTGYQVADWMRAAYQVDLGSADTFRVNARLTHSDDDTTEQLLVESLQRLAEDRDQIGEEPPVHLHHPKGLELESVMLPRDAFFGPTKT
jgi:arginine decarboxylase